LRTTEPDNESFQGTYPRSLNNPRQNRIELGGGTELQIAGEEYASINGNLPSFGDVSDIKWWAPYDSGIYREETRADINCSNVSCIKNGGKRTTKFISLKYRLLHY
jgi:hypothetical protein